MKELHANYDLAFYPARWSFVEWLLGMEIFRRKNNYDKLFVKFTKGFTNGFRGREEMSLNLTPTHQQQILDHVCKPMLALVGATEGGDGSNLLKLPYTAIYIVESHKAGDKIPAMILPDGYAGWAQQYENCITITLREAPHYLERNSDIPSWFIFAKYARERGERVVFVRDTERADEPMDGFETCPLASRNLYNRIALYRAAKTNFFVSNGPHTLCIYDPEINYIFFIKQTEKYKINTSAWWKKWNGIECGSQWPWATDKQRCVLAQDTAKNIIREYDRMMNDKG